MMKPTDCVIRVDTDGEITAPLFPLEDTSNKLRQLVGPKCEIIELVFPERLYSVFKHHPVPDDGTIGLGMLIDDNAVANGSRINMLASWLYGTDVHSCPICGNVLFVGISRSEEGLDYCGYDGRDGVKLLNQLLKLRRALDEVTEGTNESIAYS